MYKASKINQWKNDVNIGGRKKAQRLEEGILERYSKSVTEKRLGLIKAEEERCMVRQCAELNEKKQTEKETERSEEKD